MSERTCTVEGCTSKHQAKGLCNAHYKQSRRGMPLTLRERRDLAGQRFGSLLAIEPERSYWICRCDCGAQTRALTADLRRGQAITCGDKRAHRRIDIRYAAAHHRVRRDRGPASAHPCVDCGETAAQWSYDHQDPNEMVGQASPTAVAAYSADPNHYQPRCRPCHTRFDQN